MDERNNLPQLPRGWVWTSVAEILRALESGGRPKGGAKGITQGVPSVGGEHLLYSGGFDFTQVRYVPEQYFDRMTHGKIQSDDVLVVKDGATTGKTSFVSNNFPFKKAAVNEHVFILRVFPDYTDPKYLFLWMQSPFGQRCVSDNFQGTAQGGITSSFVANSKFPLAPLAEQHRIVTKVEELFSDLDAGVAALQKTKAQLKRYRQAVLKAAVEGNLTAEWRVAHRGEIEPASVLLERIRTERLVGAIHESPLRVTHQRATPQPNAAVLGELPVGWCWTTLEQLSDKSRSITYGVVKLGKPIEGGVPTLRSSNVRHLYLDLSEVKKIAPSISNQYKRTILQGDEILVTVRGTLGGVIRVPETCVGFNISREVAMIALAEKSLGAALKFFIGSPQMQTWLMKNIKGIAYIGINIETLKQMPLPVPPLAEQQQIIAEVERRLSVADEVERTVDASLKQAERLRQSILKRAFAGKLVPQDPSDEPAEKLLERIRAARMEGRAPGVPQRKRARQT